MKKKVTKTNASKTKKQSQTSKESPAPNQDNAVTLLKADHRQVEKLFARYAEADTPQEKSDLVREVCNALAVHGHLEDEIFYPACRQGGVEDALMDEAQVEHDAFNLLVEELMASEPETAFYDAKVKVLSEYVQLHVGEEEQPGSGIFAKAKAAGLDMTELGQRLTIRKQELESMAKSSGIEPPAPRTLEFETQSQSGENNMARHNQERDDQGRFVSEDDYGSSNQRGGRNDQYEDRSSSMRSHSGGHQGGYHRDDDQQSRGGGRGDYEDRGYSNRGQSDDHQRGGYGRSQSDDYQRGGYGRSQSDDYQRGGQYGRNQSQQQSGRGYSQEDSRSQGEGRGWYGDSEGHSRAAERGWENRGHDQDDHRGGRGGSQSGNSGNMQSNRGGHGGWFGDSEGHSRAAEQGWENRR